MTRRLSELYADTGTRCDALTIDGRRCQYATGHDRPHRYDAIEGSNCTCMLRWHPNRCKAHPEMNG
jgi:hypothetical protein